MGGTRERAPKSAMGRCKDRDNAGVKTSFKIEGSVIVAVMPVVPEGAGVKLSASKDVQTSG